MTSKIIETCQICGSHSMESILFLAFIPPVNQMPPLGSRPEEQTTYPLELLRCTQCSLGQIGCEVDASILFPSSYPYLSGSTKILRDNFRNLCDETDSLLRLSNQDLVVDIGSNDGTLLTPFHEKGIKVLGIEPSQAGEYARAKGIETLTTYFSKSKAEEVRKSHGAARVVTAANVFAHIPEVHEIVKGIVALLQAKGVFVSESHYFLDLVATLQYDTVYHEHLRYYSLTSLKHLFAAHDLEIFRVKRIPTHGGSIRVFAARKGDYPVEASVAQLLAEEESKGLINGSLFHDFKARVIQSKCDLMALLRDIKKSKKRVVGIGAPSRASTLINYVGLDDGLIDCIYEVKTSPKVNKFIPGTRIAVVDESKLYDDQPDYALLFSWHISEELQTNLRRKGFKGHFISPLPTARILDA